MASHRDHATLACTLPPAASTGVRSLSGEGELMVERTFVRWVLPVLAACCVFTLAPAVPAHAASSACSSKYGQTQTRTCVIARNASGNARAWIEGRFTDWTVVLKQCDGYGQNCGTIAANGSSAFVVTTFAWTEKPYSFGHTYRSHASWTDADASPTQSFVNITTPLVCCP